MERQTWLDRAVAYLAPQAALKRQRARIAVAMLQRHFEATTAGRRTNGWYRTSTDANAAVSGSLSKLRDYARDLVRNNGYAESALGTIVDDTIGYGLQPTVQHDAWKRWAGSTDCDADGRHDFAGLQALAMRTIAESGEVLIRRRIRRLEDGLSLPLQLQVLEPDFLDSLKDGALANGGRCVQGVEFDALGRRVAYWLYKTHPGSNWYSGSVFGQSVRVPATDVAHVFWVKRPGQVRGPSWFAPVLLKFKDFDELDDATLMKQKIAACLAVITSDVDGATPPLGTTDTTTTPETDTLSPGMILNAPPGRSVQVVEPPSVADYPSFSTNVQRGIATGLHVSYESLTGDYSQVNFSSARMSRLRLWPRIENWRWRMLVPQLLNPVWGWAMQAAEIAGIEPAGPTEWTAPPMPFIEPDKEGLAIMRNVRGGITTLSEEIRARGYNVQQFLDELEGDFHELDRRGLILDCDPRKMTQAGQMQGEALAATAAATPKE